MTATIHAEMVAAGIKRVSTMEPMAKHTSWHIGGPADVLCVVDDEKHLFCAIDIARNYHVPWLILGGGYNVLVSDAGIAGIVILNRLRGLGITQSELGSELQCGPGVFFAKAAQYSGKQGYTGFEWGISIPGTVGGGVVNNAGAHASDVSRALLYATVVDAHGVRQELSAHDFHYKYRDSMLKAHHTTQSSAVVTHCRFAVTPDDPEAVLQRIEDLRVHRIRTQPVKEASAGSTFKNPPDNHAGALIEQAGLKGYAMGGAQISPLHANFIINTGGATASDIVQLIQLAQERVRRQFDVSLEPEVQFVGRWREDTLQSVFPAS